MDPATSNPRLAACRVLLHIMKDGGYADRLMDKELATGHLSGPDRGLFAELVFGVLRRQGSLDHILGQLLDKPLDTLEPAAAIILRLGLYQLVHLDRVPESAAVNESVNLSKQQIPRASGLINAVLRNYLRRKDNISFPDPSLDPVAAIAVRHSHPEWLVRQWLEQLGESEAEQMAEASSRQPPLTLRINTLKTDRDRLITLFCDNGFTATPCRFSPDAMAMTGKQQIAALPGYLDGLFAIQDEAAQMAAILLDPQPSERILDVCAAPGGKATHLAQLMQNNGEVLATDISRAKLPLIEESARRLGITIIRTRTVNMLNDNTDMPVNFDRIMLDAPCSGLGVIRRNPEAKWRLSPADITRLAATQKILLHHTSRLLKPGGLLLYATCSTANAENEQIIEDFLLHHPEYMLENLSDRFPACRELFTPEGMYRAWPHRHGMDGFFAARLKKIG